MPDDLDSLTNACPAQNDPHALVQRTLEEIRPLGPAEMPDFSEERKDIETQGRIESVAIKKTFITQDGRLIRGPNDYVGFCYATALGVAEKVEGCGILTIRRECSEPLCARLMCAKHSRPNPDQDGLLLCEEHYKKAKYKRRVEFLAGALYWGGILVMIAAFLALLARWIVNRSFN